MSPTQDWYTVRFDQHLIWLDVKPPTASPWQASLPWGRIIRVCFQAGDWLEPDVVYLFTDERPESYVVPVDADGGQALWQEILRQNLFDAEVAIEAAMASNQLFCSELHSPRDGAER